ncbi:MAG: response regulator [Candidatus Binatia bacterium]
MAVAGGSDAKGPGRRRSSRNAGSARPPSKNDGFFPVAASDGCDGVEKAIQEAPILILMDIMMPGLDGLEAARILRSNGATKHIPILAATVLFSEYDLESCLQAGCSDYLVKPFTY